jgi:serine/threonine protein kinase
MAPESLRSQKYSFKTDVWSFGVLMYEILARQEPYKGMSVLDVGPKIRDEGMTPNESVIDGSVPQELRNIMKSCWKMDPDERPSFTDICTKLDGLKKDFNLTDRVVGQPTSPNLRELVNETKYVTKI